MPTPNWRWPILICTGFMGLHPNGWKKCGKQSNGQSFWTQTWSNWDLAYIYTWSGHVEEAIDLIEHLLTVPGFFTRHWLRLNPDWDPLRDHPQFQELIAEEDEPYLEGL